MLHCLALGSIVYYALELLHSTLDNELVIEELRREVEKLEGRLEELRWGRAGGGEGEGKGKGEGEGKAGSWWKIW